MDISKKYPSQVLDFHTELGVDPSIPMGNMSLCRLDDGNYLMSVRQFNYKLKPHGGCWWLGGFLEKRAYFFIIVDENFNFVKKIGCDLKNLDLYEDFRLLKFGDIIQASATDVSFGKERYKMACVDLTLAQDRLDTKKSVSYPIPHEKNYIPVEDGKGVFITDMLLNSIYIVSDANIENKRLQRCRGMVKYRGSSQLMRYRDGYVALVHNRRRDVYTNAFAFFDKSLLQCRISDEFTVFRDVSTIDFCCGMAIEDDTAILPICVHDRDTHLFRLPLQDFSKTARWRDLG